MGGIETRMDNVCAWTGAGWVIASLAEGGEGGGGGGDDAAEGSGSTAEGTVHTRAAALTRTLTLMQTHCAFALSLRRSSQVHCGDG
jgi:hypothetical protein